MKKVMIVLALLLGIQVGNAQKPGKPEGERKKLTPEQRAQKQTDRMEKQLALTPDQKPKVYAASLKKYNAFKTLHEQHKGNVDKPKMDQEKKKIRQDFRTEMKTILTPEQLAKWKEGKGKKGGPKGKKGKPEKEAKNPGKPETGPGEDGDEADDDE